MRCGASDEKRDAATGQKNPAFGGPERLIGCVAALARHLGLGGAHIALRAAPARMSRSGPSNDPIRSEDAPAHDVSVVTGYPAQHDSLDTSISKVCAASFKPSTVVRYGKIISPNSA